MTQGLRGRLVIAMSGMVIVAAQATGKHGSATVVTPSTVIVYCAQRQTGATSAVPRRAGARSVPGKSHLSLYV